jgi:hypothetical protein
MDVVPPLSWERIADSLLKLENVSSEMTDPVLEIYDFLKMAFASQKSRLEDVVVPSDFHLHLILIGGDTNQYPRTRRTNTEGKFQERWMLLCRKHCNGRHAGSSST